MVYGKNATYRVLAKMFCGFYCASFDFLAPPAFSAFNSSADIICIYNNTIRLSLTFDLFSHL